MCFPLETIRELVIWLIVLIGVVALIRLVLTPFAAQIGAWGNVLVQALNIVLWVVIALAVVALIFDLLACVFPFPRLAPR